MLQRVVRIFCRTFFCLRFPKKSVEEPLCGVFQNNSSDEKDYRKEGEVWGYQDFPSNVFRLRVPELFVGENFCAVFRKVSGGEELYVVEKRAIKIFRQIVFVSQCRKLLKLHLSVLCFRNLSVAKKILNKRGVSRFSVWNFLS